MMTRQILLVSALMTAFSSVAAPAGEGRVVRGLVDWTVDGVAVKVPHTWNVKDGCDGPGKASSHVEDDWLWGHNSVKGVGYARKAVTYRCELGERPKPGRRWFVRRDGKGDEILFVANLGATAVTTKVSGRGVFDLAPWEFRFIEGGPVL